MLVYDTGGVIVQCAPIAINGHSTHTLLAQSLELGFHFLV